MSLEDSEGAIRRYFIALAGGGARLDVAGETIRVITPEAPLARAILGKRVDDDIPGFLRQLALGRVVQNAL